MPRPSPGEKVEPGGGGGSALNRSVTGRSSLAGIGARGVSLAGSQFGGSGTDVLSLNSEATRHWVDSVSDIYGPDEIEELLEDLNRLELAAIDAEDFDIDGSQIGGRKAGARSRCREVRTSPTFSVSSWDSHAVYQTKCNSEQEDNEDGVDGVGGLNKDCEGDKTRRGTFPLRTAVSKRASIFCYCDTSRLKTSKILLRIFLLITSLVCLITVLLAGTSATEFYVSSLLPHNLRLRAMMFICIFNIFFTFFILFLSISHLNLLMPLDIGKMQTIVYLILTVAYIVTSVMIVQVYYAQTKNILSSSQALNLWTKHHLLIISVLGLICSFECFLCIFNCGRQRPYDKMMLPDSSTHFTLHETATSRGSNQQKQSKEQPEHQQHQLPQAHLVNENYVNPSSQVKKPHPSQSTSSSNAKHNHSQTPVVSSTAVSKPSRSPDLNPLTHPVLAKDAPDNSRMKQERKTEPRQSSIANNTANNDIERAKSAAKALNSTGIKDPGVKEQEGKTSRVRTKAQVSAEQAKIGKKQDEDIPSKSTGAIPKKSSSSSSHNNSSSKSKKATAEAAVAPVTAKSADFPPSSEKPSSAAKKPVDHGPTSFSTGSQVKPSTNHLDEIISIPWRRSLRNLAENNMFIKDLVPEIAKTIYD